ncbi:hypothetical protein EAG_15239 [Camponotus floridanus]|uniref:Uncharacterized protein n=1 Tax=Camponotus floridanus TaxID=104421 RepID=E2A081_CAMFO|nr:hypothetical protein EAG_15239 [Camponotus floridanus]
MILDVGNVEASRKARRTTILGQDVVDFLRRANSHLAFKFRRQRDNVCVLSLCTLCTKRTRISTDRNPIYEDHDTDYEYTERYEKSHCYDSMRRNVGARKIYKTAITHIALAMLREQRYMCVKGLRPNSTNHLPRTHLFHSTLFVVPPVFPFPPTSAKFAENFFESREDPVFPSTSADPLVTNATWLSAGAISNAVLPSSGYVSSYSELKTIKVSYESLLRQRAKSKNGNNNIELTFSLRLYLHPARTNEFRRVMLMKDDYAKTRAIGIFDLTTCNNFHYVIAFMYFFLGKKIILRGNVCLCFALIFRVCKSRDCNRRKSSNSASEWKNIDYDSLPVAVRPRQTGICH